MNWLLVALVAQIILGMSDVFDKFLLKRRFFDPLVYAFWAGVLGLVVLVFAPWGFEPVSGLTILIAFLAGITLLCSVFSLFSALVRKEASFILPLAGVLTPLATLAFSGVLLGDLLGAAEIIGFALLILGGFTLVLTEWYGIDFRTIIFVFAAAFFFGLSSVLAKLVFAESPFLTGFIWMRLGGAFFAVVLLLLPSLRRHINRASRVSSITNRALYGANRIYAGLGAFLISFAIFLSHPALVDAMQSVRYIVIFFAAWLFLRERFSRKIFIGKVIATLLVSAGIFLFGLGNYVRTIPSPDPDRPISWGITFSAKFSRSLGLDPQKNFEALLEELSPQKLRLIAYWDEIEKERGLFNFSELDWQMERAEKARTEVILAFGMKVPRWPECHIPLWAKELDIEEREKALREYMEKVVVRYLNNSHIILWQVENEPFLRFGQCPQRERGFVDKEIALVKNFDSHRPILITDGGEFGLWRKAALSGDIFGTTMYRKIYPGFLGKIFGVIEYPFSPRYFRIKESVTRFLINDPYKKFIVIELQAEPWGRLGLSELPLEEQLEIFSPEYFAETIQYAKETGFDEYYLWGAEWWYWLKEKHGDSRFWNLAKETLQK